MKYIHPFDVFFCFLVDLAIADIDGYQKKISNHLNCLVLFRQGGERVGPFVEGCFTLVKEVVMVVDRHNAL